MDTIYLPLKARSFSAASAWAVETTLHKSKQPPSRLLCPGRCTERAHIRRKNYYLLLRQRIKVTIKPPGRSPEMQPPFSPANTYVHDASGEIQANYAPPSFVMNCQCFCPTTIFFFLLLSWHTSVVPSIVLSLHRRPFAFVFVLS